VLFALGYLICAELAIDVLVNFHIIVQAIVVPPQREVATTVVLLIECRLRPRRSGSVIVIVIVIVGLQLRCVARARLPGTEFSRHV